MHNSRVLITGGLGFIGLVTARRMLAAGYRVMLFDALSVQVHGVLPLPDLNGLDSPDVTIHRGDIRRIQDIAPLLAQADYLIHLAAETGTAQSMYDISLYNSVNSQGTALILDWMANNKHQIKKTILASSRSIYGEGAYRCAKCGAISPDSRSSKSLAAHQWEPDCPSCGGRLVLIATPESSRPRPASIYAATKLAQEDLVRIASEAQGIPHVILRFQNVYGPGQSLKNPYTGILSIFSTRIRRGMDLPIFEDGLESRDFVHVQDVAEAIQLCIESDSATDRVFNVGSGIPTPVLEVARMLIGVLKGSSVIEITGQYRLGDIRHCYADISALRAATGFEPSISLEDGLADFCNWVSNQPLPEDGLDQANRVLIEKGLMK